MVPLEGFFFYSDATQSLTHLRSSSIIRTLRKNCLPFTQLWLCDCLFQEVCKGMLQDSWALARQSLTGDSFCTWDRAQDSWSCQVSPFCSFLTPAWARSTQLRLATKSFGTTTRSLILTIQNDAFFCALVYQGHWWFLLSSVGPGIWFIQVSSVSWKWQSRWCTCTLKHHVQIIRCWLYFDWHIKVPILYHTA